MEDTLGVPAKGLDWEKDCNVLILVLMEDTLGDLYTWISGRFVIRS